MLRAELGLQATHIELARLTHDKMYPRMVSHGTHTIDETKQTSCYLFIKVY